MKEDKLMQTLANPLVAIYGFLAGFNFSFVLLAALDGRSNWAATIGLVIGASGLIYLLSKERKAGQ